MGGLFIIAAKALNSLNNRRRKQLEETAEYVELILGNTESLRLYKNGDLRLIALGRGNELLWVANLGCSSGKKDQFNSPEISFQSQTTTPNTALKFKLTNYKFQLINYLGESVWTNRTGTMQNQAWWNARRYNGTPPGLFYVVLTLGHYELRLYDTDLVIYNTLTNLLKWSASKTLDSENNTQCEEVYSNV